MSLENRIKSIMFILCKGIIGGKFMKVIRGFYKKRWFKIICAITIFIAILGIYFFNFMYPYRNTVEKFEDSLELTDTLSYKQASKDLSYVC